jgi:hypothetical protein
MTKKTLSILTLLTVFYSCTNTDDSLNTFTQGELNYDWTVPKISIVGKFNPFTLAENPSFTKVKTISNISDNELVALISINNEIRVYPYKYISFYECINDNINTHKFALTYCPRTQSTVCWDRNFKSETFVLRASGYLFKENLVAYDTTSNTYWSQMLLKCIKGKYADEENTTFNVIETTWKTASNYFPEALVFTDKSIKKNQKIINLKKDTKFYGIINNSFNSNEKAFLYKYKEFENGIKLYTKSINSRQNIIIGGKRHHFITSFINDSNAVFSPVQNKFPIVMKDDKGNSWDIFGVAISGSRKGVQLASNKSYVALEWAWKKFYTDLIFNE